MSHLAGALLPLYQKIRQRSIIQTFPFIFL
ncbi:hypothetical protein NOC27_3144 [Nitrosococcus oceani AFC27]|nr:hypothetical protein NOC27_3144 [Nitrosococcus oceani AFC27]